MEREWSTLLKVSPVEMVETSRVRRKADLRCVVITRHWFYQQNKTIKEGFIMIEIIVVLEIAIKSEAGVINLLLGLDSDSAIFIEQKIFHLI